MNICVLIDAWEPIWGGGQTHVREISKILISKYHHHIDIFTRKILSDNDQIFSKNEQYYQGKLNIIRVGPIARFFNPIARLISIFSVTLAVIQRHKYKKYDLIHAHAYLFGIPGKILSKILGIPIIFTVHGSNLLDLNKITPMYFIEKFILTQIKYDQEISVSKIFLKYRNTNSNIAVIPNGINLEEFDQVKKSKSSDKFSFLWIGRYDRVKGLPILINAYNKLLKQNKHVQLVLVGDGPEKNNIQLLVNNYQIDKYVTFIPKINHKQIIKLYKQANIFVLPSLSEGQAITVLEAMAAKLPVIATNVGDNKSIIKNRVSGFLVSPNNVQKLYSSMLQAIENKNLSVLISNAYLKVKQKYLWQDQVAKINNIYQRFK